ncbi:ATP synthase subunit c chloroplastic [Phtheirospermum japonicum]|uniref:ATP synthase subunit c chloroplastic n=1 Tax=Phtheirospermum japonicum TaxID=374723 RepID=A0A830DP39_9LAMI|nr:ATP synthase subunit c chloroplastic [Phtheirospermum japonicum]
MEERKFYKFTKTLWVRGTYHESTDFCCFRYCCWIGCRACFYWTWNWSRDCCGSSRRGYRETARGRGENTRYSIA